MQQALVEAQHQTPAEHRAAMTGEVHNASAEIEDSPVPFPLLPTTRKKILPSIGASIGREGSIEDYVIDKEAILSKLVI